MAEEQDQSQKTEEPTQKRLDEARSKGQVASSREVNHWFMILAAALVVILFAPAAVADIGRVLRTFLEAPDAIPTDLGHLRHLLLRTFGGLLLAGLLPLALLIAAALGAGLFQHGFLLSAEQIKPKLEKISPLQGMKRLFSLRSFAEFVKGVLKLAVVGTVGTMLLLPELRSLTNLPTLETVQLLYLVRELAIRLLVGVVAVMTVIAGLDYLYQRYEYMKRMRMSKQELKEEFKQSEGDPIVKARLRQIRTERARRRMMAAVPEADVVVTNPTHFAVALKYEPATMSAPRVTAKGADLMAQRIREVAEANGVPVVENPPLARGLYAAVELDEEIPPEHYKAVAEVIGYIMKLKRRQLPAAT